MRANEEHTESLRSKLLQKEEQWHHLQAESERLNQTANFNVTAAHAQCQERLHEIEAAHCSREAGFKKHAEEALELRTKELQHELSEAKARLEVAAATSRGGLENPPSHLVKLQAELEQSKRELSTEKERRATQEGESEARIGRIQETNREVTTSAQLLFQERLQQEQGVQQQFHQRAITEQYDQHRVEMERSSAQHSEVVWGLQKQASESDQLRHEALRSMKECEKKSADEQVRTRTECSEMQQMLRNFQEENRKAQEETMKAQEERRKAQEENRKAQEENQRVRDEDRKETKGLKIKVTVLEGERDLERKQVRKLQAEGQEAAAKQQKLEEDAAQMKLQLDHSNHELQSVQKQLRTSNAELTLANTERLAQEATLRDMKARVENAEEKATMNLTEIEAQSKKLMHLQGNLDESERKIRMLEHNKTQNEKDAKQLEANNQYLKVQIGK